MGLKFLKHAIEVIISYFIFSIGNGPFGFVLETFVTVDT